MSDNAAMAAKKKASGVNIPETQRSTVQVKLRLPPDVADDLDALASRWGVTRSGAVAHMLDAAKDAQPGCGGSCLSCCGRCAGMAPLAGKVGI